MTESRESKWSAESNLCSDGHTNANKAIWHAASLSERGITTEQTGARSWDCISVIDSDTDDGVLSFMKFRSPRGVSSGRVSAAS